MDYLRIADEALADYRASKRTTGAYALELVKASGVRLVTHHAERVVVVAQDRDTPELRALG
jgi:hypothetical protein